MNRIVTGIIFVGIVLTWLSAACQAEVYKWVDAQGNTHYSSKPLHQGDAPAKLPPIMRAEMKLPQGQLSSCAQHGGVNCEAGPDGDGSVICFDGFRDAAARFRFSCSAPKLEISNITDLNENGGFTVILRNSKSVRAEKPRVTFKQSDDSKASLVGPAAVDPFGMAEFHFIPAQGVKLLSKPNFGDIDVTCANCP